MIEAIIYASGVTAVMSILILVITISASATALILKRMCFKELKSLYLHAQLLHFMKKLEKEGVSKLKSDAQKFGYKVMDKGCDE